METNPLEKEFLEMITAQQRTVFKVCYIYAKDQDDLNDLFQKVADILGISKANVAVKLNRTKEKLKQMSNS